MATIHFKGKSYVQNHHLTLKYHHLVPNPDASLTDKISLHDNLIVHGDNLLALKALLPTYAGKVKCIYIDPPYNTGNEGWIYNDNVNSPIRIDNYTCNKSADERPNLYYPIVNPNTGEEIYPNRNAVWRYSRERHLENEANNFVYWGKDGTSRKPSFKRYRHLLKNGGNIVPSTWWTHEFAGHTDEAKKEIRVLLSDPQKIVDFVTPKPKKLLYKILLVASNKDSIILDSFAGSGTTAHAVLALNQEDGGNRKFILVEMEDYAESLTAERVRRVIKGVPKAKDEALKNGLGGSFSFFELGDSIEMQAILEGHSLPTYEDLARYVFYTATGDEFDPSQIDLERHYIGENKDFEVYLFYKSDLTYLRSTALDLDKKE